MTKRRYNTGRWSKDEDALLTQLAGIIPTPYIYAEYNRAALIAENSRRQNDYGRSADDIQTRMFDLDLTDACFSQVQLSEVLGVGRKVIKQWQVDGLIKFYTLPNGSYSFRREQIEDFLTSNIDIAKSLDPDCLEGLVRDVTVEVINGTYKPEPAVVRTNKPRQVQNVSTGQVFESCKDAAKVVFFTPKSIGRAARSNGKAKLGGHEWRFLD